MPLALGTRLGPYEILAPIDSGGMGDVYRARDTRLGRDVAIKVSHENFTERFEREARAIAALNHPNICHLYDVGPNYLVMELIEGARIKGPLPLDTALDYARQIAEALEAAHDRGIIHRDLKPANILITNAGVIKVLDFGLAKNVDVQQSDPESSPTLTVSPTRAGMILGTAAYMAPEQARGKSVDKRADIWAFGVVLYEILTGKRLFQGETVSDILAGVLKEEPDLSRVPQKVQRLLRSCLRKDPKQRLHDIADAKLLLDDAPVAPAAPSRTNWFWPAAAATASLALAALAWVHFHDPVATPPVSIHFQIAPPAQTQFGTQMALSPNGRMLAFNTLSLVDGSNAIWVQQLDAAEAKPLPGALTLQPFFWSADSRFIAFSSGGKLMKADVSGGPSQPLCDAPNGVIGGFWTQDGTIVFGQNPGPLMRVSASGGTASPVTAGHDSSPTRNEVLPALFPDGKHILYFAQFNNAVFLTSFGAAAGTEKHVLDSQVGAMLAPSQDSVAPYFLFLRDGTLMAQAYDASTLTPTGSPGPLANGVGASLAHGFFSVSNNGVLAYRTGLGSRVQLTWFDRAGKELGSVGPPGDYRSVALSPDGTHLAASRVEGANLDVWVLDLDRHTDTRFTSELDADTSPFWSPDGSRIAYLSGPSGSPGLFVKPSNGDSTREMLLPSSTALESTAWSSDGRFLLYSKAGPGSGQPQLWSLSMEGERKSTRVSQSEFSETQGQFSPDGKWISYTSIESGKNEIYIRPFPPAPDRGGRIKVSEGGGTHARWRRDGQELFYISSDRNMMAVDMTTSPTLRAGVPKPLFQTRVPSVAGYFHWDISADGKRFLIATLPPDTSQSHITIVTNWQSALRK